MKEYLKMSDVFDGEVVRDDRNYITCGMNNVADFGHNSILSSYASHAINSHDELVAEVERLTRELKSVTAQLIDADDFAREIELDRRFE